MRSSIFDLKPPANSSRVDLLVIAGERSGDQHAADVVNKLKQLYPQMNVVAFGGEALKAAGADLILDMTKFSVVGLYEVLVRFFFFSRLLRVIFQWIKVYLPRAVCFVDYPGFNLRLAKMLYDAKLSNKAGGDIKVLYYIAPQVWAWKESRCRTMEKLIDELATILPFEKQYFNPNELSVSFVGHPFAADAYHSNVVYNPDGPVLLLPGSRISAIKKIYPMLLKIFAEVAKVDKDRMAVVVYPNEEILVFLRKVLSKHFRDLQSKVVFISDGEGVEASAAIMSSGTMSLKCCLSGIPGAIVYRSNYFTYMMGKLLVRIKWLGLANILLKKCIWREFLQSRLRPKGVARYILQCLNNEKLQHEFREAAVELKSVLSVKKDATVCDWLSRAIGHV